MSRKSRLLNRVHSAQSQGIWFSTDSGRRYEIATHAGAGSYAAVEFYDSAGCFISVERLGVGSNCCTAPMGAASAKTVVVPTA